MKMEVDWSKIPEGYDWVAQDEYGDVFAYKLKPNTDEEGWSVYKKGMPFAEYSKLFLYVGRVEPAWEKTLQERPKENALPKTKEEVEAQFCQELSDLLKKYDATLDADDEFTGYAECGEDIRMRVYISSVYDGTGKLVREGADIDLGQHFSGEKHG